MRFLLRLLLPVFLLVVVFEEQKGKHAEDAADPDADRFTLHTGGKEMTRERVSRTIFSFVATFLPVNQLLT